ncbi:MAG: ribose-phosphate pyrophosphokinase [Burkholderiaceae bacterium]|nr:ribose-phosphate pyrophosphokinase [Burkholderiaceae bacterium]
MLVLALPGQLPMAQRLARSLRCECSEIAQHRFPDGETLVRIDVPVKDRCVILTGSLNQPDDKTLARLFAADAARELGAARVGLVAPYLAYMRQDHRFKPGEAITSRSYARLLGGSLDFLVTVDPHLHRWRSLDQIYPVPTAVVSSAPAIARWVRAHIQSPLIVGPDSESRQWVDEVAGLCGAPSTVLHKTRRGDYDVRVRLLDKGPWRGLTPVLLDDIVSTGRTLQAAARALLRAGLGAPVCVVVHPLFAADALAGLHEAGIARVVSCDSIAHASNAIALAPALARAVRAVRTPDRQTA